ncbi:MAG: bifunctional adenosylcobinamide kinase/adenosylcobinamide-phosphate guanylyltransferase [Hyphomicrobiaceae bacterium]|nr:bifunctional adenosylcobinamide kinase/adenosylcobinamide-phosphate guanylyltransferase [Hyphomicrobiaceae bacterium]
MAVNACSDGAGDGRDNPLVELVLGGARSGKSRYGERRCEGAAAPLYIATAQAFDDEMAARIDHHRARRDGRWSTVEVPLDLADALDAACADAAGRSQPVLVDCLTLWLTNVMLGGRDVEAETARLLAALARATRPVILVSNEVGLGLVPETALGRAFRDAQGRLNQAVAAVAGRVVFIAAGLPLVMKGG